MHRPPVGRDIQKNDESRSNKRLTKAVSTTIIRNQNPNMRTDSAHSARHQSHMSDTN